MSGSREQDIRYLLDLMDDENEQTASLAMAELLRPDRSELVNRHLRELQETARPGLRRRVHQLESAIGARTCRSYLAESLRRNSLYLLDGAIRLHLCWFDNDRYENVAAQWNDLKADLFDAQPSDLTSFGEFMLNRGLCTPGARDDIDPEHYCIGAVIDDTPGSDLLLSLISAQLVTGSSLRLRVIRRGLDFGVADHKGNQLFPSENWRAVPARRGESIQSVSDGDILRMIASVLFFCAVSSHGFRYAYTLGSVLAAALGEDSLDFLPYPYGTVRR